MSNKNSVQSCQGKDVFSRMNFLYQASVMMAGRNNVLSAYYGNLCKSIGKKSVLRMAPNIKRTLCKRCSISLKPKITSTINIKVINGKEEHMQIICNKCGYIKSYLINPNYKFWLEDDNSIVERYKFNKNLNNQNNDNSKKCIGSNK